MTRAGRGAAAAIHAAALLVAAVAGAAPPDVLLITVDTLRADAVGWVGGGGHTPVLDRLASEGLHFAAAVSPVPLTLPAHASLMTGLTPLRHGVHDNGQVFGDGQRTLAEQLRAMHYDTAAFVSGFPLARGFGLDRGFAHYDDTLPRGREGWLERRADETTAAALAWLRQAHSPWFAWVHYYDPHDPYDPPRPFWQPGPRGAYLGEVAFVDLALGRLLDGLGQPGPGGRLTVVTADHGESLGDHRESTHGYFIYDTTVAVPLVIHLPGRIAATASPAAARLVDVVPTILELVGAPPLDGLDGVSLTALADGGARPWPAAVVETRLPFVYYGWAPLVALRDQGWKLIDAPRPELYDLRADPGETVNLAGQEPARAAAMRRELERQTVGAPTVAPVVEDPALLAGLQALGYVGAGDASPPAADLLLADPKDRIALRDRLQAAETLLRADRFDAALAELEAVLAVDPDNRAAVLRAGIACLEAGRLGPATTWLRRAVTLDPTRAEARYALADALGRGGDHRGAATAWRELTELQPRRLEAWLNLATSLRLSGQAPALAELAHAAGRAWPGIAGELAGLASRERADGRDDEAAGALLLLALIEQAQGRPAEAKAALAEAVALSPDLATAAAQLGLGERHGAAREPAAAAGGEAPGAVP